MRGNISARKGILLIAGFFTRLDTFQGIPFHKRQFKHVLCLFQ